MNMHNPVNDPVVTSPYGMRGVGAKRHLHDGIDYVSKGRDDKSVFAIWDGEVLTDVDYYDASKRWTDKRHSAGNFVIIRHVIDGKLYYTRYIHLGQNLVSKGDTVKRGQKIGEYADAGYSFGAHLHLDMYDYQWKKINPTPMLEKYGVKAR